MAKPNVTKPTLYLMGVLSIFMGIIIPLSILLAPLSIITSILQSAVITVSVAIFWIYGIRTLYRWKNYDELIKNCNCRDFGFICNECHKDSLQKAEEMLDELIEEDEDVTDYGKLIGERNEKGD